MCELVSTQQISPKGAILWGVISEALFLCIKAHGPITSEFVGSAVKRVVRGIINNQDFKDICPDDEYNKLIVDSLETLHTQEIGWKEAKINRLNSENYALESKIKHLENELNRYESKLKKEEARTKHWRGLSENSEAYSQKLKEVEAKFYERIRELNKELEKRESEVEGLSELLTCWRTSYGSIHHG